MNDRNDFTINTLNPEFTLMETSNFSQISRINTDYSSVNCIYL